MWYALGVLVVLFIVFGVLAGMSTTDTRYKDTEEKEFRYRVHSHRDEE